MPKKTGLTGQQKSQVQELPQDCHECAGAMLAGGIPWPAVVAFLVTYGPVALELVERLIDVLREAMPARGVAGDHCPEHIQKIKDSAACILCCAAHLEREHADKDDATPDA